MQISRSELLTSFLPNIARLTKRGIRHHSWGNVATKFVAACGSEVDSTAEKWAAIGVDIAERSDGEMAKREPWYFTCAEAVIFFNKFTYILVQ